MKISFILFALLFASIEMLSQCHLERFTLVRSDTVASENYCLVTENGKIKKLNPKKYLVSLTNHENAYFAVFSIKGQKGWTAIDYNEGILFEVYNTVPNEPWPDFLIENKIRIVGKNEKIGFANECGEVIIPPQFEFVTHFHNNKAIIAQDCKKKYNSQNRQTDYNNYIIECKHGYIDERGRIIKLGNYTFEEIQKEINWKPLNDE